MNSEEAHIILAKNAALQKELAEKNRALEIESSLEKVRGVAMGMKEPSHMLEICRTISQQLALLNVKDIRNVQTAIIYESKGIYLNFEYYAKHDKTFITEVDYGDPLQFAFVNEMLKGPGEFFSRSLSGEELKNWYEYQKTTNVFIDSYLETAPSLSYYWFSLGPVALGISTYSPLNEENISLFKRFRNVFELSYKRYLDIEQAEAQAHEARIQLALERVRARTMAMYKSDELAEAVYILFQQFKELGENPGQATVGIVNQGEWVIDYWVTMYGNQINKVFKFSIDEPHVTNKIYEAWKAGKKSLVIDLSGNELREFMEYRAGKGGAAVDEKEKRRIINVAFFSKGLLNVQSNEPGSVETIKLLERFAAVFDQTYTRFLDLQKAEVQAREAQIEAALEKVRSRSLAVQKSDEFNEVIKIVFERLQELDIPMTSASINIFIDDSKDTEVYICGPGDAGLTLSHFRLIHFDHPISNDRYDAFEKGLDFFAKTYSAAEKNSFYKYEFEVSGLKNIPDDIKKMVMESERYTISMALSKRSMIVVNNFEGKSLSPDEIDIIKRFSRVFEQAYVRFLDLQRAEAQTRDAEIELALERIRARTMSMQKQDDLLNVTDIFFEQLLNLGFDVEIVNFSNGLGYRDWDLWVTLLTSETARSTNRMRIPWIDHPYFEKTRNGLDNFKKGIDLNVAVFSKEEKDRFLDHLFAHTIFNEWPDTSRAYLYDKPGFTFSAIFLKETWVSICKYDTKPFTDEQHAILRRFANAFGQAYTRFLDLQKAEAQAREAQIEAALEKIRSRSLAMQSSNELQHVVGVLFEKLKELGLVFDGGAGIVLFDQNSRDATIWVTSPELAAPIYNHLPYDEVAFENNPIILDLWNAKATGEDIVNRFYSFEEKNRYFNYVFKHNDKIRLPDDVRNFILNADSYTETFIAEKNCLLGANSWTRQLFSNADVEVMKRVAKVFEQAYIRFLDLQKAEEQAREAQIQLALERVRARTMAMQHSDELSDTAYILFQQFRQLGDIPLQITIGIFNEEKRVIRFRVTGLDGSGSKIDQAADMSIDEPNLLKKFYRAWKEEKTSIQIESTGKELVDWVNYRNSIAESFHLPTESISPADHRFVSVAFFSKGLISFSKPKPIEKETVQILERFAAVFDQTYTRFLDLQKAEAQAREAQIETALEKVRSRSLAMHHSQELEQVAGSLFDRLAELNLSFDGAFIFLFEKEKRNIQLWIASKHTSAPHKIELPYDKKIENNIIFRDLWHASENGEHILNRSYSGESKNDYFRYVWKYNEAKIPDPIRQIHIEKDWTVCLVAEKNSIVGFDSWSGELTSDEDFQILIRFARVFEQAYVRFLDLQKAEAQAKEAQIETSLERVRSRTLAMQKSDELAETAAVLFRQLILLGIAPNRLYITIMKDDNGEAEFWITDEDGSKVTFAYTANLNGNPTFLKMFEGWRQKQKTLIIDMEGEELQNYFQYLKDLNVPFKGSITQTRRTQHIAYFSNGFVGMAAPEEQPAETLQLLERFAYVFNLTFIRFNDLKIAEAHALQAERDLIEIKDAKKKAEDALSDLQLAQKQLIQSEKMASLGELTAGIAHEIQNPLNFVNNFSEVNKEMIDEATEKLEKGNIEEAKNILNDLKDNEEKINHHGKRADAIVKGMLQHSRKTEGIKERTDINALCDEYLRLSYHGMRAKDKSFNATLQINIDDSIGKINIIPQDIGRVLLNLYNNAFYAVSTKASDFARASSDKLATVDATSSKLAAHGPSDRLVRAGSQPGPYVPTVTVITKNLNDNIEIRVKDNGPGIPQNIIDKIFQPFFTTKPTGQGTGLGLSLSYDIIKAHGGEIKVKSVEGEGSEFIIQLPA